MFLRILRMESELRFRLYSSEWALASSTSFLYYFLLFACLLYLPLLSSVLESLSIPPNLTFSLPSELGQMHEIKVGPVNQK